MKLPAIDRSLGQLLGKPLVMGLCVCAAGLLTACEAGDPGAAPKPDGVQNKAVPLPSAETNMVYEFERWRDDFPFPLHVPPRRVGEWYDRNRQQALEKVVKNLSGLCTKDAWLMSKEFFDRHMDESRDLLIEQLDAARASTTGYDHAENILGAMGRQKWQGFAPAIARALRQDHPGIKRAASQAMVKAGDAKTVLEAFKGYQYMSKVERLDWIKAAANHLPDDKLLPLFRSMLTSQGYADMFNHIFAHATMLPPKRAKKLFDPIWLDMPEDLKLHVAGVMHAAGDERGTVLLKQALTPPIKIEKRKIVAIEGAEKGDPTMLLDELLQLTLEDNPTLNVMIMKAIRKIAGERVDDTLLTMTDITKPQHVRQYGLLALRERGHTIELDQLVEMVKTEPEGTKYRGAIQDLAVVHYGKVVPVLLERMKKASSKAEIYYIRKIAQTNQRESFAALKEIFMRPEYTLKWKERHSNVTVMGVQFSNLSTCMDLLLGLLDELPKADYRRRAALIHALANYAGGVVEQRDKSKPIYDALRRRAFDMTEWPQVRILALDYIRKDVTLDDAMDLRAQLAKEKMPMRQYLSDYLFEFF